ncbi:MAG: hypothetical protein WC477_03395 [Patescibacteria group bacterium]
MPRSMRAEQIVPALPSSIPPSPPSAIGRDAFEARRRKVEEERQERIVNSTLAKIDLLEANVSLARALHYKGLWINETDVPALNKIRDAEITLSHLIEQNEDDLGITDERALSRIRERCAIVLKDLRGMIAVFQDDAKSGVRDDTWDDVPPTVIDLDSKGWNVVEDKELTPSTATSGDAEVVERDIQPHDFISSRGKANSYLKKQAELERAKKDLDLHTITDQELEQTVDKAFEPILATDKAETEGRTDLMNVDVDAEMDRVFEGTEKQLLSIPSSLEETRSRYLQALRVSEGILEDIHRLARPSDDMLHAYLVGLSKSYAEFEERLNLIRRIDNPTEENLEEKAVIADAMHAIEDTRHQIHTVVNNRFEPVQPKKENLRKVFGEKTQEDLTAEKLDRQLNKKAAFKEELEGFAAELNQLIEKSNPKIVPEVFMPTYAQKGATGWLARAFATNQPKIKARDLEQLIIGIGAAQQRFDSAYYSEDERVNAMPVHGLIIGKSSVADTWRALNETISRLDEDTSTPISLGSNAGSGKAKMQARAEDATGANRERIENQALAERYREQKIENEIRLGVPNGAEILRQIDSDPNADKLTFISSAYLVALAELIATTETNDFEATKEKLEVFQSFNDELLENGIAIDDAQAAIENAEHITRLRPRKRASSRTKKAIVGKKVA